MQRFLASIFVSSFVLLGSITVQGAPKSATLEDLKKLEITCFVPSYLPAGFHLREIKIDRDDREGLTDKKAPGFPTYSIVYGDGKKHEFSIESARWGIGDRNVGEGEETEFKAGRLGTIYVIYEPAGKTGPKKVITANWVLDENWKAEEKSHPRGTISVRGRAHGFSSSGISLQEFEKIVQSIHPVKDQAP